MRIPRQLEPLADQGLIHEVIRPLLSGKEADVYLVESEGEVRVAKVYKEASNRSFKHRAAYTEGRKVRNSRRQRAMDKRSRYGRRELEEAWRTAEVDAIYRLRNANVRVPEPYHFIDGVLIMELVRGEDGGPAPRLVDIDPSRKEARELFDILLRETVKMLCAGVVHGDLSDFNVLIGVDGPVIIDFPQWVDATQNRNAEKLLVRDVDNLTSFLARYDRRLKKTRYGREMWQLYRDGSLSPDTELTGKYRKATHKADTMSLLEEIEEMEREVRARRERLGLPMRPARKPIEYVDEAPAPKPVRPADDDDDGGSKKRKKRRKRRKRRGRSGRRDETPRAEKPKKQDPPSDDPFDDLDALLISGD